jgi:ABC-type Fe3+-hydroxamate transport system substrate-binding protein
LVYFEEWDEPMLSGIAGVSELIEIAGGIDIFADRSAGESAKERIATAEEIIARRPDIIIGSWSGKKFRPEKRWAAKKIWGVPMVRIHLPPARSQQRTVFEKACYRRPCPGNGSRAFSMPPRSV